MRTRTRTQSSPKGEPLTSLVEQPEHSGPEEPEVREAHTRAREALRLGSRDEAVVAGVDQASHRAQVDVAALDPDFGSQLAAYAVSVEVLQEAL